MKCATVNIGGTVINMCVVPVNLTVKTHELLDSCSQGTFMLVKLLRDLGMNGQKTSATIKTINGEVNNEKTMLFRRIEDIK